MLQLQSQKLPNQLQRKLKLYEGRSFRPFFLMNTSPASLKAIIGLGNPGKRFERTRHNIGFSILDALADEYNAAFKSIKNMELADIIINDNKVLLIKPQTFMNNSGEVLPYLQKQGIKPEEILVVHDELELPFGTIKLKFGGSHKGHNGLKSIIDVIGKDFWRLRFGISRPEDRTDVSDYVLSPFSKTEQKELDDLIKQGLKIITEQVAQGKTTS